MRASLLALMLLAGGCATPTRVPSRVLATRAAQWNDVARPQPAPRPVEDRFAHENFRRESRR
jgi:hypothetical protein